MPPKKRQPRHLLNPRRSLFWQIPGAYKITLIFAVYLLLLVTNQVLSWWFIIWYLLLSLTTYWLYANDKQAAIKHLPRTSERKLQLFGLLGGWPGALLARHRLRHKTVKTRFRLLFWCGVVVNLLLLVAISQYSKSLLAAHW
ncbi:DUF1294 domain-containing protein [Shewanella fodinae]|uniref:Uncharacterized membrane protein YsdA (DUF1294 family) n=1 Tax=Shewanella fodinae TaxID=552357 RepID=A0A4R2F0H9_9GAMM|nr:DUF1294 domain-containing protein [Shewanella fodinae]TCN76310.1 uncharacterized membrane protein YsdA (DUF1294 family) [Shewanella fodinae]